MIRRVKILITSPEPGAANNGIIEQKLLHQHVATVTNKKKNPNYGMVRGFVPQYLLRRFKIYCADNGIDYSQGLEKLLHEYFEWKEQQTK